jgi:hypothetical protein
MRSTYHLLHRIEHRLGFVTHKVFYTRRKQALGTTYALTQAGAAYVAVDVFKRLAIALSVSADALLFDEAERGPDEDLRLQFEALSAMSPEEKQVAKTVLEAMIVKSQVTGAIQYPVIRLEMGLLIQFHHAQHGCHHAFAGGKNGSHKQYLHGLEHPLGKQRGECYASNAQTRLARST